jgi:DNA-binding transcriptional regulator GbsR (MarR family)
MTFYEELQTHLKGYITLYVIPILGGSKNYTREENNTVICTERVGGQQYLLFSLDNGRVIDSCVIAKQKEVHHIQPKQYSALHIIKVLRKLDYSDWLQQILIQADNCVLQLHCHTYHLRRKELHATIVEIAKTASSMEELHKFIEHNDDAEQLLFQTRELVEVLQAVKCHIELVGNYAATEIELLEMIPSITKLLQSQIKIVS